MVARSSLLTRTDFSGLAGTKIGVGFAVPKVAFPTFKVPRFEVPSLVFPKFDVSGLAGLPLAGASLSGLALGNLGGLTRFHDVVGAALRGWRDLFDFGTLPLRQWGRRALRAALRARQAVLMGRWDEVRAFVREWLDLKNPTVAHVEAAADALLAPDWEPAEDPDDDWPLLGYEVLEDLRFRTLRDARSHRWISETQINGQRVALLDKPTGRSVDDGSTLLDLVAAKPEPEGLAFGIEDERLARVVALMSQEEREVCLLVGDGHTWGDAAVGAGFPAEFGERVRRKRTRLVAEVDRRATARRTSSTGGR
jgi:hypothetical protein